MTSATSDENPFGIIRTDQRGRLLIRSEQRQAILAALDQSTLSVMGFCRQHGLCFSTVAHWNKKRRRSDATPSLPVVNSAFVEVSVGPDPTSTVQPNGLLKLKLAHIARQIVIFRNPPGDTMNEIHPEAGGLGGGEDRSHLRFIL